MNEEKPLKVQHFEKPLEIPSFMNRKQHEEEAVKEIFSNTDIISPIQHEDDEGSWMDIEGTTEHGQKGGKKNVC